MAPSRTRRRAERPAVGCPLADATPAGSAQPVSDQVTRVVATADSFVNACSREAHDRVASSEATASATLRRVEAKQAVRELLDKLPDDCTIEDVLYHVYVLHRVSQGLAEADAGELIPHEQVREELRRRWQLGDGGPRELV
jgi:predicted transcriptional regulator